MLDFSNLIEAVGVIVIKLIPSLSFQGKQMYRAIKKNKIKQSRSNNKTNKIKPKKKKKREKKRKKHNKNNKKQVSPSPVLSWKILPRILLLK